jgi:hypothetical protein
MQKGNAEDAPAGPSVARELEAAPVKRSAGRPRVIANPVDGDGGDHPVISLPAAKRTRSEEAINAPIALARALCARYQLTLLALCLAYVTNH